MRENSDSRSMAVEFNLLEILLLCLRKWWLIALCCVLTAAIAVGYTIMFVTPQYRSNASIYVNNSNNDQVTDYLSSSDLSASKWLVNGYMRLTISDRVLDQVAERLNNDYTPGQIGSYITTSKLEETQIFQIFVTHPVPAEAARIVNVVAEVVPEVGAEIIEGSSAKVIDLGDVSNNKVSPSNTKAALSGGAIGVVLAVGFLVIQFLQDTRIKDEEELLALFDLPVLGRIPDFEQEGVISTYEYGKKSVEKEGA